MTASITFYGAAGTVTGSRYLIEAAGVRILVDCGLFQGWKALRQRNWSQLPFNPATLDAVILTHAHIDHTGYFPKLCAMGFRGRAYCTTGTRALAQVLLPDSGYLQEEDARRANRYGYTRHAPALPLYTRADAEVCLRQLAPIRFYERFQPARGVTAKFTRAGHIVGSACLQLRVGHASISFTGDVGRPGDPVMKPPDPLDPTDMLVTESTYGDRLHPPEQILEVLADVMNHTAERGGVVLVPAFAVGRAQHLLHAVAQLKQQRRIPDLPVFLDSPMAINATGIFCKHKEDHGLSESECHRMCEVAQYSRTPDESKAIDRRTEPAIIVSASGMATGGRILHHLRRFLPDERNTVLLVGYQAGGTRGRALADGASELKIHGQVVRVGADVVQIQALSAHADYREMLAWFKQSQISPRRTFVTHGEPSAAEALRHRLSQELGWKALVPELGSTWLAL